MSESQPCASNDNLSLNIGDSNELTWSFNAGCGGGEGPGAEAEGGGAAATAPASEDAGEQSIEAPEDGEKEEDEEEEEAYSTSSAAIPAQLSCWGQGVARAASGTGGVEDMKQFYLGFDYDIRTVDGADLPTAVRTFEIDLLRDVADMLGLGACEEKTKTRRSLRRASSGRVLGVGSYPLDTKDDDRAPVCDAGIDPSAESSTCTPMNGAMTVWVSGPLTRDDIYSIIQTSSNGYSTSDVLGVSYHGARPETPYISAAKMEDGHREDLAPIASSAMSPGAIAGVCVASALALLAVLALVARARRGRMRGGGGGTAAGGQEDAADGATRPEEDDYDNEEEMLKVVRDDTSRSSIGTEDYTHDGTFGPSGTFESEDPRDDPGYEVQA